MKRREWMGGGLLVVALIANGCSKPAEVKPPVTAEVKDDHGHDHEHEHGHSHGHGPNGGVVFDLGSHHAEFTVDHDKQQATIVILGDDEKTPAPIAAEELTLIIDETKTKDGTVVEAMTVSLKPEGATEGKAAKFVGTDPGIGNVADFSGSVSGKIEDKPALGNFKE